MSRLEYIIWHILGYSAMPFIILTGFAAVAVICVWLLSITSDKEPS
ncbi:TIGR02808 family protein [Vibrio gallicus]|nr:TIGR02808 family protein [Vibrio gallicus]